MSTSRVARLWPGHVPDMPPRKRTATPKGKRRGRAASTSKASRRGRARRDSSNSSAGSDDGRDGDGDEQRPSEWAKTDRSKDFAETVRGADVKRGFGAEISSGLKWAVVLALVAYAAYLASQRSADELVELASRTATQVTSAVYDFGAGAITEPGLYVFLTLVVVLATWLAARRRPTVYLVDFETYVPPDDLQVTMETFLRRTKETGLFSQESIDFQEKILRSSTLCEQTYFPPGIMKDPMRLNLDAAREEAIMVMGGAVEQVLEKTGTRARDIDVVVVNCSLFCPTPSLASILVNKFKMRSDVLHYSLGGMGCSAGLISIDLVERIMHSRPGTTALVVSTENITLNWYRGDQKSMLISNCLFRVGAAAVLLSNKRRDARRAKFKLKHLVRTHMGANDDAFHSVYQVEDDKKVVGVSLSKKIMQVAGDALRSNMTRLGPLVLPFSEQLPFVFNLISRKVLQRSFPIPRVARTLLHRWLQLSLATPGVGHVVRACSRLPADAGQPKDGGEGVITGAPYVPDFKKAFDFFCIHAGGRAVLDAIEKNLQLTEHDMMPSRATLRRFGNTSSSSVWYELDFIRKEFGVKRGQKVWQIAFGSGFLCNSAVWEALRPVHD